MAILGSTKVTDLTLLDGVIGNLNPVTTGVYDLGTSSLKWRTLYGNAESATKATYVEGSNNAANPGGALLRSGAGRADASPAGDTWIYWDTLGGTTNYWGIRHNQAANTIGFCGSGTEKVTISMAESKVTATTFDGTATKATQDESGNNIKASYASSITISDHTITLKNKNGASLGTVTVPDNNTNYYPTAFAWTNGTTAGPTGSLTGSGMSAVSFAAIPSASTTTSGIITTDSLTVAGNKFTSGRHIGLISGGEVDQFLDFAYAADPTASKAPGASWRVGALNSGSGDTNYFVILTGGSDTNSTTWSNAIRIGMNTLDVAVNGNLYALSSTNTKTLGTSSNRWKSVHIGTADTYGSSTLPIYWNAGVPTAIGYTIATSVPSGAVFTDTKNTAGSTDTSSKIFLIGATSQAANPQTYSDNEVYATNGQLDARCVRVAEHVTMLYNTTTNALDFIFA